MTGYVYLLAEPFPQFGPAGEYPFDARVDDDEAQSRCPSSSGSILAIPALLIGTSSGA